MTEDAVPGMVEQMKSSLEEDFMEEIEAVSPDIVTDKSSDGDQKMHPNQEERQELTTPTSAHFMEEKPNMMVATSEILDSNLQDNDQSLVIPFGSTELVQKLEETTETRNLNGWQPPPLEVLASPALRALVVTGSQDLSTVHEEEEEAAAVVPISSPSKLSAPSTSKRLRAFSHTERPLSSAIRKRIANRTIHRTRKTHQLLLTTTVQVEQFFHRLYQAFNGKETEHNWTTREHSITTLRDYLQSFDQWVTLTAVVQVFLAQLKSSESIDAIKSGLCSLRTSLSAASSHLVSDLATTLTTRLDPLVPPLLQTLTRVIGTSNKLNAAASTVAIKELLKYTNLTPRSFLLLTNLLGDKAVQVRMYGIQFLETALRRTCAPPGAGRDGSHGRTASMTIEWFEKNQDSLNALAKALGKGVGDANPAVRKDSRELLMHTFYSLWPERAIAVIENLDPTTRKQLEKHVPNATGALLVALQAGTTKGRRSMTTPKGTTRRLSRGFTTPTPKSRSKPSIPLAFQTPPGTSPALPNPHAVHASLTLPDLTRGQVQYVDLDVDASMRLDDEQPPPELFDSLMDVQGSSESLDKTPTKEQTGFSHTPSGLGSKSVTPNELDDSTSMAVDKSPPMTPPSAIQLDLSSITGLTQAALSTPEPSIQEASLVNHVPDSNDDSHIMALDSPLKSLTPASANTTPLASRLQSPYRGQTQPSPRTKPLSANFARPTKASLQAARTPPKSPPESRAPSRLSRYTSSGRSSPISFSVKSRQGTEDSTLTNASTATANTTASMPAGIGLGGGVSPYSKRAAGNGTGHHMQTSPSWRLSSSRSRDSRLVTQNTYRSASGKPSSGLPGWSISQPERGNSLGLAQAVMKSSSTAPTVSILQSRPKKNFATNYVSPYSQSVINKSRASGDFPQGQSARGMRTSKSQGLSRARSQTHTGGMAKGEQASRPRTPGASANAFARPPSSAGGNSLIPLKSPRLGPSSAPRGLPRASTTNTVSKADGAPPVPKIPKPYGARSTIGVMQARPVTSSGAPRSTGKIPGSPSPPKSAPRGGPKVVGGDTRSPIVKSPLHRPRVIAPEEGPRPLSSGTSRIGSNALLPPSRPVVKNNRPNTSHGGTTVSPPSAIPRPKLSLSPGGGMAKSFGVSPRLSGRT